MTDLLHRVELDVVDQHGFDDRQFAVRRAPASAAARREPMPALAAAGVLHLAMAPSHLGQSTAIGANAGFPWTRFLSSWQIA